MAVDFLRSCHTGLWRFYSDRPDVATKGRFYFCDPSAPHLGIPHTFGSRTWWGGTPYTTDQLGEDPTSGMHWYSGYKGIPIPPPVPIGDADSFANPTWGQGIAPVRVVNGVDARCWTNVGQNPDVFAVAALDECELQLAMALCINALYNSDFALLQGFFNAWLGAAAQVLVSAQVGLFPATCYVIHPDLNIVIVSGTSTFQQLALQAIYGLNPPQNFGTYSTLQLWQTASTSLLQALTNIGLDPMRPTLFVGHSYGGVLATLAAVRIIAAHPTAPLYLMTFGTPKIGDARLQTAADKLPHLHIVNRGDFVPSVPGNPTQLIPYIPEIGNDLWGFWQKWVSTRTHLLLLEDGSVRYRTRRSLDEENLPGVLADLLAGVPLAPVADHAITTTITRLLLRCPNDDGCLIPADALKILKGGAGGAIGLRDRVPPANGVGLFAANLDRRGALGVAARPVPAVPATLGVFSVPVPVASVALKGAALHSSPIGINAGAVVRGALAFPRVAQTMLRRSLGLTGDALPPAARLALAGAMPLSGTRVGLEGTAVGGPAVTPRGYLALRDAGFPAVPRGVIRLDRSIVRARGVIGLASYTTTDKGAVAVKTVNVSVPAADLGLTGTASASGGAIGVYTDAPPIGPGLPRLQRIGLTTAPPQPPASRIGLTMVPPGVIPGSVGLVAQGGGAPVNTTCCANSLAANLYASIRGLTCAASSIPIAYTTSPRFTDWVDDNGGNWEGQRSCSGHTLYVVLCCSAGGGGWIMLLYCDDLGPGVFLAMSEADGNVTTSVCSPLHLVFDQVPANVTALCGCYDGLSGNVSASFTE